MKEAIWTQEEAEFVHIVHFVLQTKILVHTFVWPFNRQILTVLDKPGTSSTSPGSQISPITVIRIWFPPDLLIRFLFSGSLGQDCSQLFSFKSSYLFTQITSWPSTPTQHPSISLVINLCCQRECALVFCLNLNSDHNCAFLSLHLYNSEEMP